MAYGDFSDLINKTALRSRLNSSIAEHTDRIEDALNEAYLQTVSMDYPWDFLQVDGQFGITANNDTYSYATIATALGEDKVEDVLSLVNDTIGSTPMQHGGWEDFERFAYSSQDGDAAGYPVMWASFGGDTIRFWPKPDSDYAIGGLFRLGATPMTSGTDVPVIPLAYRESVLVNYAAAIIWRQTSGDGARRAARDMFSDYESGLDRMIAAHGSAREPELEFAEKSYGARWPGGTTLPSWEAY